MRMLDLKLTRDILKMKGQTLAIVLVLAAGIAMFLMSLSTYRSLYRARERYYQEHRFADVFAGLKSAPLSVREKIEEIPGVTRVHTRNVRDVNLDIAGMDEISTARLVSLPVPFRAGLNDPYLRQGRYPESDDESEVLISELFARANHLSAGERVTAIINGRRKSLEIVGIALSPEYIFAIKAGNAFPDNQRFGIFWMGEKALEAAFNMEGAFNDVTLKLSRGANLEEVIDRLNRILEPYGGLDAHGRKDQLSHWFLESEFDQLKTMGYFIPVIFFAVAIFLLHIVLTRIIRAQRAQIGVLKAFGYGDRAIGFHFLKLVILVVIAATILGGLAGARLGAGLTNLYGAFYVFPSVHYRLELPLVIGAFFVSLASAILGTLSSVGEAARMPPAEAMRPEAPATFGPTILERIGLGRLLSTQLQMILRQMERQPLRSLFSMLGISLAVSLVVFGRFNADAIYYLIEVHFNHAQRQDVDVVFYEAKTHRAFNELSHLAGVIYGEPIRAVPARLRFGHRTRRVAISGIPENPRMLRPLDKRLRLIEPPENGLVLGRKLAEVLGVHPGESVAVEMLEGKRTKTEVRVTGLVDEYIGVNAYMTLAGVNRLMGEDRNLSGAYLQVDPLRMKDLQAQLKEKPAIAGVTTKRSALESFKETMAENIMTITVFNIIFSCIIAFGVVYNSAHMSLAERSRDLATLRVLGFTRGEISFVLLGELALLTLAAIPVGFALGSGFAYILSLGFQTELFRIPFVITPPTYGMAAITIIVSALISGLVVRRKLDRLDLLAVLKTRE